MTRAQLEALLIVDDEKPYANAHRLVRIHDDAQRAEIERLQAQLAGWKELEGKDIYQYCVDLRGTIQELKTQLATAKREACWTKERPTAQGHYWLQDDNSRSVLVFVCDDGTVFWQKSDGLCPDDYLYGGEWQGPLKPKEPA